MTLPRPLYVLLTSGVSFLVFVICAACGADDEQSLQRISANEVELSFMGSSGIDAEIAAVSDWDRVVIVLAGRVPITDDHFVSIARKARNLRHLDVSYTNLSRDSLGEIARLPKLQFLSLAGTQMDDETLQCIDDLVDLEEVNLAETKVTNEAVVHLRKLAKLQSIDIRQTALRPLKLIEIDRFSALRIKYSPKLISWEEKYLYEQTKKAAETASGDIVRYTKVLAHGGKRERILTIDKLYNLGLVSRSPDALIRNAAVKDRSAAVRSRAVELVGRHPRDPDNFKVLLGSLVDPSMKVRISGVEALGSCMGEHKEAAQALVKKGMYDIDPEVAESAADQVRIYEKEEPYLQQWIAEVATDEKAPGHTRELASEQLLRWNQPPETGEKLPV